MAVTPPITRDELHELACHRAPSPMTTCYLDVDGRRFVRPADLQRSVDNVLRRARALADGDRSVEADLTRIGEYVHGGLDRSATRGLAIFANDATGFWKVVALPSSVPNHVTVSNSPVVGPLEVALTDHEPIGVLLVDRAHLRMLVFSWGQLVDQQELVSEILANDFDATNGREEGHLDGRAGELEARQVRNAARTAFDVQARTGFHRLVVGGPDQMVAEIERTLHPYLRKIYHGRIEVSPGAAVEEIRRAVERAEVDIARGREAALVGRLRDVVGRPNGRSGAAGLAAVLDALADHRVERLLVSDGFEAEGWHCGACGRLATVGPDCPRCGAEMAAVPDVVSEAIDATAAERARVDVCVGNADLDVLGRIGALLRY